MVYCQWCRLIEISFHNLCIQMICPCYLHFFFQFVLSCLSCSTKHNISRFRLNLLSNRFCRELMAWASEFLARMSAPELSENLQDAVTIHSRHRWEKYSLSIKRNELFLNLMFNRLLHDEMSLREADLDAFEKTGLTLIKNGHFMGEDITEKIATLNSRWAKLTRLFTSAEQEFLSQNFMGNIQPACSNFRCFRRKTLRDCWELRNSIYEQHMDYLKWLKVSSDHQ